MSNVIIVTTNAAGSFDITQADTIHDIVEVVSPGPKGDPGAIASLTVSTPLTTTGGDHPNLSMPQAASAVNGYLAAQDWATFNAKEPAVIPGAATDYYAGGKSWKDFATAARNTLLTGLSTASAAVVSAADSVLSAFGKLQQQITGHVSATGNVHGMSKVDIGLGNVDNTADINKPVSTLQGAALDAKVDKVTVTGADLNTLLDSGFYRVQGSNPNMPYPYSTVIVSRGTDTAAQLSISYTTGNMSVRGAQIVNGVAAWTPWRQVVTDNSFNNLAPALNGAGAYGSWNINSNTTNYANIIDGTRNAGTLLPNSYRQLVRWDFAAGTTAGTGGNYAGVMTVSPYTGATVDGGDGSYQLAFGSDAANAQGQPQLMLRNGINATWNQWVKLWHSGNLILSNNGAPSSIPQLDAAGQLASYSLTLQQTAGIGQGVALYPGYIGNAPSYGIMFAKTANFGSHGTVSADWATYLTMDATAGRGWVFRNAGHSLNVASVDNVGNASFSGVATVLRTDETFRSVGDNCYTSWSNSAGLRIGYLQAITGNGLYLVGDNNHPVKIMSGGASRFEINPDSNVTSRGTITIAANDENVRSTGDGAFLSFWNKANTARSGYLQANYGGKMILMADAASMGLAFGTNYAEKMWLDNGGTLIVGSQTASWATSDGSAFSPGTAQINHKGGTPSGAAYANFLYNGLGNTIGSITQNGTTGVLYNTSSDRRLKTNIADAADSGALIDALQVRSYDWKSDGSHQRFGFVAQELDTVFPEAVSKPADPEEMMGVDYSKLVPLLVKEVQNLRKQIATLTNQRSL